MSIIVLDIFTSCVFRGWQIRCSPRVILSIPLQTASVRPTKGRTMVGIKKPMKNTPETIAIAPQSHGVVSLRFDPRPSRHDLLDARPPLPPRPIVTKEKRKKERGEKEKNGRKKKAINECFGFSKEKEKQMRCYTLLRVAEPSYSETPSSRL